MTGKIKTSETKIDKNLMIPKMLQKIANYFSRHWFSSYQ